MGPAADADSLSSGSHTAIRAGDDPQTVGMGTSMVFFMGISFVYGLLLLFGFGQVYHVCKVKRKPTFFVLSFCVLFLAVLARLIPSAIMFTYTVDRNDGSWTRRATTG